MLDCISNVWTSVNDYRGDHLRQIDATGMSGREDSNSKGLCGALITVSVGKMGLCDVLYMYVTLVVLYMICSSIFIVRTDSTARGIIRGAR